MQSQLQPTQAAGIDPQEITTELLKPTHITPKLVQHTIKRARRTRLYYTLLTDLEKAILQAASKLDIPEYRNPRIKNILATIIARIETHTMKGKTILTGLKHILTHKPTLPNRILEYAKQKLDYILYLGRNILTLQKYYYNMLIN